MRTECGSHERAKFVCEGLCTLVKNVEPTKTMCGGERGYWGDGDDIGVNGILVGCLGAATEGPLGVG